MSNADIIELAKLYTRVTDRECFKINILRNYVTVLETYIFKLEGENKQMRNWEEKGLPYV